MMVLSAALLLPECYNLGTRGFITLGGCPFAGTVLSMLIDVTLIPGLWPCVLRRGTPRSRPISLFTVLLFTTTRLGSLHSSHHRYSGTYCFCSWPFGRETQVFILQAVEQPRATPYRNTASFGPDGIPQSNSWVVGLR